MDRLTAAEKLGLGPNPSEEEVKNAYKNLAMQYNSAGMEPGPQQEDARRKMDELNEAFDVMMSWLRAGQEPASASHAATSAAGAAGGYPALRQMINSGQVDEALAELTTIKDAREDAEWNFLMGSAYYYKGFLDQALFFFQTAARLAPGNREYDAALRNLQQSANGQMPGNPYPAGTGALNCACNTCACTCCLNSCCGGMCG